MKLPSIIANPWRIAFVLIGGMLIALLFTQPFLWKIFIGPLHYGAESNLYPFLDMHGRLAAFDATRAGIEILHNPNPYDPLHRINIKPTWPLHLSFLGLGREHLILAGATTVILFLGILFSILQPKSWKETFLLLIICFSPPILLGIERANDDLVYLILLSAIPLLLKLKTSIRFWLIWCVIFLLAPAKYYPGAVFLIFLLEIKNWRLLTALLAAGILFLVAYLLSYMDEILYLRDAVPKPTLFMVHGASLTFESLGLPAAFGKFYSLALIGLGVWIIFRPKWPTIHASISHIHWFLLGYSIAMFCFVLNSNYDYRFVYTLLMLPLLLALSRQRETHKQWAVIAVTMMILLIPIFWADILQQVSNYAVTGSWSMEAAVTATQVKNVLFCIFMLGSTGICATVLRPNIRELSLSFRMEFRKQQPS